MEYSLYIVGTPIGNLKDISMRAIETLQEVDIIACEDTRHSLVLLNHYNIKKKLVPFHKFNSTQALPGIIEMLKEGKKIALITDAGMPCISDPGIELIRECIKEKITYTVIGGVTAFVNALIISGFDSNHFVFVGFLPEKLSDKQALIKKFQFVDAPAIYYCSPHNIDNDLKTLFETLGDRSIAVVKEISKIYETVEITTLEKGFSGDKRGEFVVIVNPAENENSLNRLSVEEHLQHYIEHGMDKKEAIKQVAKDRNIPKNEVYKFSF